MNVKSTRFGFYPAFLLISLAILPFSTPAARFVLPDDSNIIGDLQIIEADPSETLVDVARRFGLGYDELQAANPDVDLWVPKKGQEIVLPTRFILPDLPLEGIIINIAEMRMYYFPDKEREQGKRVVYTFPIGIGREGWDTPVGVTKITEKKKDPAWFPPASILAEHEEAGDPLPKVVPAGPDNPLGAFAMRLGIPGGYMIHGTNKPSGVGMRVSHGCIRMYPEDIANLFELSQSGLKVTLIDEPYKVGFHNGKMLLEAHVQKAGEKDDPSDLSSVVKSVVQLTGRQLTNRLRSRALEIIKANNGMPQTLGDIPEGAGNTPAYFLQLGEFPSVQGARQMSTFFSGLQVATLLSATPGNKYCRVLVGPFHLKSKAEGELRRIHSTTGIEGMILPKMETQNIPHCSPEL